MIHIIRVAIMRFSLAIIVFGLLSVLSCNKGQSQDTAEDDVNWEIIERVWNADTTVCAAREVALKSMNQKALYSLQSHFNLFIQKLKIELAMLSEVELASFNHFVEKKLYTIDRAEIHTYTDGGDDGFYYARGFILGLGKEYFNKVDQNPKLAVFDAEFEYLCFVGYEVYYNKFKKEFERYKFHNTSTMSNTSQW